MIGKIKKIALVAGSESTKAGLVKQLEPLLKGYAEIESYATDTGLTGKITADLIVMSSKYTYEEAIPYIDGSCPSIIARRALNMSNIDKLFSLPKGMEVLIVNDLPETTLEAVDLFMSLGIDHLKMIPYYPGSKLKQRPSVAITPGESSIVPDFVEEIIDIGPRIIDLTTIVEILEKLGALDEKAHYVSAKYLETIIRLGRQLYDSIGESNRTNEYLLRVLNQVNDGIIAFDHSGRIKVFNQKSEELFRIHHAYAIGKSIYSIVKDKNITDFLLSHKDMNDKLFKLNDEEIIISKFAVEKLDSIVCTLKNSRELAEMEYKLRRTLIYKGHIGKYHFEDIIGESGALKSVIATAKKISKTDLSILIHGESGTGKELFSSAIHNESDRASGPFLAVNFSALSEDLAESELFGYEEGAFTGAKKGGRIGLFEQANNGTIFLDEIGDTSLKIQARLLRVLQEKEIMRVGGTRIIPINVRVISATNKDLLQMCREGRFREDLYYRLKKLYLNIPSLKERKEDVATLVRHFLIKNNRADLSVSEEAIEFMRSYDWPGNVRELENTIEYMVAVCEGDTITCEHLPQDLLSMDRKETGGLQEMKSAGKREQDEFLFLLEKIREYNENGVSIGRKTLSALSGDFKYPLSEEQVRCRANALTSMGLLVKTRGRSGMQLSEKGAEFLKRNCIK